MKPFSLNLSKFKKVGSDRNGTSLLHPDGHVIYVAHKALSPKMRAEFRKLETVDSKEHYADGGNVSVPSDGAVTRVKESYNPRTHESSVEAIKKENYVAAPLSFKKGGYAKYADGGDVDSSDDVSNSSPSNDNSDSSDQTQPQATAPVTINIAQPNPNVYQPVPAALQQSASPNGPVPASDNFQLGNMSASDIPPAAMQAVGAMMPQANASDERSVPNGGKQSFRQAPAQMPMANASLQQASSNPFLAPEEAQSQTLGSGVENQIAGITQASAAQSQLGQQLAQAQQQYITNLNKVDADRQAQLAKWDEQRNQLQKDFMDQKVDPSRLWSSKSAFSKASTILGFILGGLGSGLTGQRNQAIDMFNRMVDQDIEAQKLELGKRQNLLGMHMQQYRNINDAVNATKVNLADTLVHQLQMAAAQAQSPLAKANAIQAIGTLQTQYAPIVNQMALRTALRQNPQVAAQNPSEFIKYVVPEKEQPAAYKEMQEAQQTHNFAQNLLSTFDQLSQLESAGNYISSPVQTPSQVKALKLPLTAALSKNTAGRFTEQDANYLESLFPTLRDNDKSLQVKRHALQTLIEEKMNGPGAFPVLQGNGIPVQRLLNQNSPIPQAPVQPNLTPDKIQQVVAWAKANPNNPYAQAVMQKAGMK